MQLWRDERPRVTLAVAAAAAQGDRSENAEYTYGKRRLREIDRRVRFLRKRLDGMTVVDADAPAGARSGAGVLRRLGRRRCRRRRSSARYRIVGPDEFDMAPGYISMDSPLGRALLRQAPGRRGVGGAAPGSDRASRSWSRSSYARPPTQITRTFLNCHGSLLSMSSGNSRSRS